ncbi:hypothetical protein MTR_1g066590 [Medicago truncatula]|uniref:Uncharacterized protein n=1 Tax=Medicago truncatula TaxID=3880 RepID=A0A072VVZ7_MEDTR|nr:hypothetical protein MTR_1g066590 [Medicago truncatula]
MAVGIAVAVLSDSLFIGDRAATTLSSQTTIFNKIKLKFLHLPIYQYDIDGRKVIETC